MSQSSRTDLRGGAAVAPPPDQRIDAGDQGLDVGGEAPGLVGQEPLTFNQGPLAFNKNPLAFDQGVENLLRFQVLLADADVELREPCVLLPVGFAEQAHHLLTGLARGQAAEPRDQGRLEVANAGFEVGEACPHLAEPRSQILVEGAQRNVPPTWISHGLSDAASVAHRRTGSQSPIGDSSRSALCVHGRGCASSSRASGTKEGGARVRVPGKTGCPTADEVLRLQRARPRATRSEAPLTPGALDLY